MKYEVLGSQVIYLNKIVEADSKEQAWEIAINEGDWNEYEAERVIHSETFEIEGN
jgi:hypothetical protein